MKGVFNLYCLECHRFVEWRKIETTRADLYGDWRVEIFCGCGPVDDHDLEEIAYQACRDQGYADLQTAQQDVLDAALTRSGNLFLETLAGMDPGR